MSRHTRLAWVVAISMLVSPQLQAADLSWQGGAGTLLDANYFDGTTMGLSPTSSDVVNFGNGGTATFSGFAALGRLRVGHNQAPTGSGLNGQGTVTLNGFASLELISGASGVNNGGLQVGQTQSGVLNITDGSTLTVNRLVEIGIGNNADRSGTLNVNSGGWLLVSDGNLVLGTATSANNSGLQGIVNISDSSSRIDVLGAGTDIVLAPRLATATFTQTDGTVQVIDSIEVSPASGRSTNTSFNISGGTFTTNNGNFFVGRGAAVNPTVDISGTATVNVGNRYLMGGTSNVVVDDVTQYATGITTNHSGGTLNVNLDIRVADVSGSDTMDSTYILSGTGVINTNVAGATEGTSTVIGRQGIGRFIQTGGTANFNSPLVVGNRETATASAANGLYKISAGDLNVTAQLPSFVHALSIAPNGTGEFRVVGDDASINVFGDFAISSTENGTGTLAFELEAGNLLSQINVNGAATLGAGSIVRLDATNASPTASSYDLLTATSITDSGLLFSGPSGWGVEIVSGGLGQILRAVEGIGPVLQGDYNEDGIVNAADYVIWRKTNINGAQGYTDWRTHFGEGLAMTGGGSGTVPEPAAAALVLFAAVALAGCRRRVVVG